MIFIIESVDAEAGTITWQAEENSPPEHDVDGRACHAMNESVFTPHIRSVMRKLDYQIVSVKVDRYGELTFYWAKRP